MTYLPDNLMASLAQRHGAGYVESLQKCGKLVGDRWEFDEAGDCWKDWQQDRGLKPSRGAGDIVKKVTQFFGIRECGGCAKRRKVLNKILPIKPRE